MTNQINRVFMTPCGVAQVTRRWTDGIFECETDSHGGFFVEPDWNAVIPEVLIAGSENAENCRMGWYEKDEDWAIVVHTFPFIFGRNLTRQAEQYLRNNNPNYNLYLDGGMEELCRDSHNR